MRHPYILLGEVVKPQGVAGECKVRVYTSAPERYAHLQTVYVERDGGYEPVSVTVSRLEPDAAYLTLEGVGDRNTAEALRGTKLYARREDWIPLRANECYVCDMLGCEAYDAAGAYIGTLKDVLQNGATDVYVFDTPRGEMMAPALLRVFPEVDVATGRIAVCRERLDEVAVFAD